ncbi:uncharacterized protein KY384_005010 [Bacidia gigantensis]|uniref:uncharacterized protein n=1 Tax=Bacidia gigantensis TaxID=2732470 RepID=UPI001D036637|nr:uncharacterized protein KY384_005010 [Bacidia gigantensis]KAG8530507.1 hypothetical protein KY384_005010 [Bacidia gigantensis]
MWDQLSVNKPHYAYLILGGFTSLFMLVSLFVKEKMYIGEATVATLVGVIFGPHAANIFDPSTWGNVDQITLECSRVVLVVQCFAVGVELPKAYMERHWRSVVFLLVPVMTYGWLATSLFIWWLIEPLTWLESLMIAACVTATDPVLASSVVGKGKFAKRVPKHLRDVLSAESGCNDGMAFPFIYLSYYLIHYRPDAGKVAQHWLCNTVLYECIWGATYGVLIGYAGRHAIKWADRHNLVDRESFLVFYFVLALFCAGTGATLGTDDLLVGFAAGVGFSNDGWFTQKTEESHVSNVIDLLLNLAYFVYLGSIIPWAQYNNAILGITPWRLVCIALLVIFFRRIPIMLALKPIIPDVKTWREALFAGHFGPIGVGAIFACLLARAELSTDGTDPLPINELPTDPHAHNYAVIQLIWPITTFLVMTSILVHGSSIAVFTLGKRINQFTLTMSYTQANEEGPTWMNRLPRMASTAKSSASKNKDDYSAASSTEKLDPPEYPPGTLPPIGLPNNFLRRQKEEDTPLEKPRNQRRKSKWDAGMGPGGPISQSAITPQRRQETLGPEDSVSDTLNEKESSPSGSEDKSEPDQLEMEEKQEQKDKMARQESHEVQEPELEVYEEDNEMIVEDEEGNVVGVHKITSKSDAEKQAYLAEDEKKVRDDRSGQFAKGKFHPHERDEGSDIEEQIEESVGWKKLSKKLGAWDGFKKAKKEEGEVAKPQEPPQPERKQAQAAHAYQFGQTLIVEDEDGEVIRKIDLRDRAKQNNRAGLRGGVQDGPHHFDTAPMRQGLRKMSEWAGMGRSRAGDGGVDASQAGEVSKAKKPKADEDPNEDRIRFTVGTGGRRMSKQEFVEQLQQLDPKTRRQVVEQSDAPREVKDEVQADAAHEARGGESAMRPRSGSRKQSTPLITPSKPLVPVPEQPMDEDGEPMPIIHRIDTAIDPNANTSKESVAAPSTIGEEVPTHDVSQTIKRRTAHIEETAAERRRRLASQDRDEDSEDDGTERVPPFMQGRGRSSSGKSITGGSGGGGETAAERRRRIAALAGAESSDSEDDGGEREPQRTGHKPVAEPSRIRFAEQGGAGSTSQGRSVQWGEAVRGGDKGKEGGRRGGDEVVGREGGLRLCIWWAVESVIMVWVG